MELGSRVDLNRRRNFQIRHGAEYAKAQTAQKHDHRRTETTFHDQTFRLVVNCATGLSLALSGPKRALVSVRNGSHDREQWKSHEQSMRCCFHTSIIACPDDARKDMLRITGKDHYK
jgi:hypothetical protein